MTLPTQWFWVLHAVDGRVGVDGLLAQVLALGRDARDGAGYVFCNARGNRLRVLVVDATGVWLCHRRLHRGSFVRPQAGAASMVLTVDQMRWLSMGVDWQRLSARDIPEWI